MIGRITPPVLGSTYRVDNPGAVLQTLIAPASNTKGIQINMVAIYKGPGPGGRIMSKASAPSAWNDATARTIFAGANEGTSANQEISSKVALPILVPPGEGVYFQASAAGVAEQLVDMNATIL